MSPRECAEMLAAAGLSVTEDEAARLVEQTEGWPAGLYLCALALREAPEAVTAFRGSAQAVAEYLRDEILSTTSPEVEDFLLRTSVLDEMTGSLCDALLRRTGSASLLAELAEANRFVVHVDQRRDWYRYHHLFRDLLQSELRQRASDGAQGLHARASVWLERDGDVDAAICHAHAAGEGAARGCAHLVEHHPVRGERAHGDRESLARAVLTRGDRHRRAAFPLVGVVLLH